MFETLYPILFTNWMLIYASDLKPNIISSGKLSLRQFSLLSFSFSYFALIQPININYLLLNAYHVPWFFRSTIYLCFLVLIIIVILHLSPWLFDYCLSSVDCKLHENRAMIIFCSPLFSYMPIWRPVTWPSLNIH